MKKTISLSSYDIVLAPIQESLKAYLKDKNYSQIVLLVDEHTEQYCLPKVRSSLSEYQLVQIQSGEVNKSLETCSNIWSRMAELKMDRHSLLINLGGGVIGDMGGFAASCYMRGLDFIQIPTTLLSQVDASVGGKLAIDFQGYKNFIGLFRNPEAVLIDPVFLQTLPQRELRSGFAEMIKHALIRDQQNWERLVSFGVNWKELKWQEEIYTSVLIKKEIVEEDPTERGLRKILNFGHTIGHAIESLALKSNAPLLHGEAIALGMIAESVLSASHAQLSSDKVHEITGYISNVYDDLDYKILNESRALLQLMQTDKKNRAGVILFSLLETTGESIYDIEVSQDKIIDALQETLSMLADT